MSRKRKEHSLTGRITFRMMLDAFKAVKRNRGAAGIDKVSVQMFDANRDENLTALMRDLKSGAFEPHPLRRAYIAKTPTQKRPLGIPAVRDRVAQDVVRRLLTPIFERPFPGASYGFRAGRNCHQAVRWVLELYRRGHKFVLDADIQRFFDHIPHPVLMAAVAAEVADGNILRLVEKFLTSGVMEDGVFKPTTIGTPQGGVISPLLANIVLNHLDWQLHKAGYQFARYADDFVVLCRTRRQAEEARRFVEHLLRTDLGLRLSPEKTQVTTFGKSFDFLGFRISSRNVRMRHSSVEKLKEKVRRLTIRHHNLDASVIGGLNQGLRGTANFFAMPFSNCRGQFRRLDAWIRMRLRCMKFKRKSKRDNYRLRVKHFRRLGLLSLVDFCHG